jgi:hypothetical protein
MHTLGAFGHASQQEELEMDSSQAAVPERMLAVNPATAWRLTARDQAKPWRFSLQRIFGVVTLLARCDES